MLRAAAPLRPRRINNGGMSRASPSGFIRRGDSGAFCRHHARPLGLRRTPEAHLTLQRFSSALHRSTYGEKQPLIKWGKKSAPLTGFHTTLPDCRRRQGEARRGGGRKKDPAGVFLPSKRHCLSVAGGSSKGVLGSSDSADKTAEQTSTKLNT